MSLTTKGRRLPRWARKRPPAAGRALAGGPWAIGGTKGLAFAWQRRWPLPTGRLTVAARRFRREQETGPAFPCPRGTLSAGSFVSLTNKGQRLPRWAHSARHRRGGRWPVALGHRRDKRRGRRMAGSTAPATREQSGVGKRQSILRSAHANSPRWRAPSLARRPAGRSAPGRKTASPHRARPAPMPSGTTTLAPPSPFHPTATLLVPVLRGRSTRPILNPFRACPVLWT